MIIDIPQQNPIQQLNKGDLKGSIKETFNVDLSTKPDKFCLPIKTKINVTDTDLSDLGIVTDFVFSEGAYYALNVGNDGTAVPKVYRGGDAVDDSFTLPVWTVNTTDFVTNASGVFYENKLIYHAGDIWSLAEPTDTDWTSESTTSLAAGKAIVFKDRVYVISATARVSSYVDPATPVNTGSYTFISTGGYYDFSGMAATSELIWVTTINNDGGNAVVFSWDGVTENVYDGQYEIPDTSVISICVKDNIPYITTGSGIVMAFNGSYFEEVARFPFTDVILSAKNDPDIDNVTNSSTQGRWIHNNGMEVIGNKIHFLVSPAADANSALFGDYARLAGIWCYDQEIGLYHRYAISISDTNGEQGFLKHVGALRAAAQEQSTNAGEWGSFLFSFSYYTENDADTEKYAIGYAEPIPNDGAKSTGYITTNRIYAQNIADTWEKVCLGFEDMNSADSIITKYRRIEKDAFNVGIVWTSDTTYTSTDTNLATVKTNFDAGIGYESRILYGDGSGVISQITGITVNAGTYTITVDTAHNQTPTNTAVARLENWEKVDTITDDDNNIQFKQIPIGKESNWIQYKFVLNGTETALNKHNPVINRIVSVSNQHTKFQ